MTSNNFYLQDPLYDFSEYEIIDNHMLQCDEDITHNLHSPLRNFCDILNGVNDTSKEWLDLLKSGNNTAIFINKCAKFVIGNNIVTFGVDCLTTQVDSLITNGTTALSCSTVITQVLNTILQTSTTIASTAKSEIPTVDNYHNTDLMKKSATNSQDAQENTSDSQDAQENASDSYLNSLWSWSSNQISKAMTWFNSSSEAQIPTTKLTEHNDEVLPPLTEIDNSEEIVILGNLRAYDVSINEEEFTCYSLGSEEIVNLSDLRAYDMTISGEESMCVA